LFPVVRILRVHPGAPVPDSNPFPLVLLATFPHFLLQPEDEGRLNRRCDD
jgi:hypothetical protein